MSYIYNEPIKEEFFIVEKSDIKGHKMKVLYLSDCFIYLINGKIKLNCEHLTFNIKENDVIYIPKGFYAYVNAEIDQEIKAYLLKFDKNFFINEDKIEFYNSPFVFEANEEFKGKIDENLKNCNKIQENNKVHLNTILDLMLNLNLENIKRGKRETSISLENSLMLDKALAHLNKDLTRNINFQDLCDEIHYSMSYISEIFKKVLGLGPMRFRMMKIILNAKIEILNGSSPTTIQKKYNFINYTTFYRENLSLFGMKPSEIPNELPLFKVLN